VKGTGGYRAETETNGKILRGRPGPTQRSRANDMMVMMMMMMTTTATVMMMTTMICGEKLKRK